MQREGLTTDQRVGTEISVCGMCSEYLLLKYETGGSCQLALECMCVYGICERSCQISTGVKMTNAQHSKQAELTNARILAIDVDEVLCRCHALSGVIAALPE